MMPDLTDVNIKDLLKLDDADLRAALEAMLPKPTLPEHMLGLWAQHPEYGRVLVAFDRPDEDGYVIVAVRTAENPTGAARKVVPVSNLTFPHQVTKESLPTETEFNTLLWGAGGLTIHDKEDGQEVGIGRDEVAQLGYAMLAYAGETQPAPEYVETEEECAGLPHQATRPEDVKPGEAWLVDVNNGQYSYKRVVALKDAPGHWRTAYAKTTGHRIWYDEEITLIAPLVPATPGAPYHRWGTDWEEAE